MSSPAQLRLAARIHYALKPLLGEGIDVPEMLRNPAEAREILFVCLASENEELVSLARQFQIATEVATLGEPTLATEPGPQDALWAQDTSGFGHTRPPGQDKPTPKSGGWLRGWSPRPRN